MACSARSGERPAGRGRPACKSRSISRAGTLRVDEGGRDGVVCMHARAMGEGGRGLGMHIRDNMGGRTGLAM